MSPERRDEKHRLSAMNRSKKMYENVRLPSLRVILIAPEITRAPDY